MTNTRLAGATDETLRNRFLEIPGISHFAAFGYEWISQKIRESSRLRMLVPRIYGLGDLSQILDERACDQAVEILSALGGDLEKFVITDAHHKSAKALEKHGFVLLLGEAAAGKSTIAAALAVAAIDNWKCRAFKVRNASEFVEHSNPQEPRQFFWVDDAFGATQFDSSTTADWNSVLMHMMAAIRRGARIVFTSRDYVYKYARDVLKESAFPLLQESHVVIKVNNLSTSEREQILYNHLRLGTQSRNFRKRVKDFLPNVARHADFKPEIARRLGNPFFTKSLTINEQGLEDFVAEPLDHLTDVIRNIDSGSRSALAAVFMRGGKIASPVDLEEPEIKAAELIGGSIPDIRLGLNALQGGLVMQVRESGQPFWKFKHPTVRDAFAQYLADDPELLDVYLAGAPLDRMINEICCGKVTLSGVKLIVPDTRFDIVIDRILEHHKTRKRTSLHDGLLRFLRYRCDDDFLRQFVAEFPEFACTLRVGSYLDHVTDVGLLARLHGIGILPENVRQSTVGEISRLAIETPDAGCLSDRCRAMFTVEEFENLLIKIKSSLIECLESTIEDWEYNFDLSYAFSGGPDPEGHFEPLKDALACYEREFASDQEALDLIEDGMAMIENAISTLEDKMKEDEDPGHYSSGSLPKTTNETPGRSVFDDIDS